MADRLTDAFNALRAGGAVFAGRVRLTNWSDNARGMNASIRLDASADPLDNPTTHPFKGAHCSPKDGEEFMVLFIPVAREEAKAEPPAEAAPETSPAPAAEPERPKRDVTMAQRAALFCQEKDARGDILAAIFFAERYDGYWYQTDPSKPHDIRADQCLKMILGIKSKRELDTDIDAATAFQRISRELFRWRNEEAA